MNNFDGLGLHRVLAKSLAHMKYDTPTPIQAQAIPFALEGRDVLGSAQTGTGKTAAFSVPLIEFLLRNERGTALVMTPTRELGKQVMDVMHQLLGPKSKIKTAFLIGGEPMGKQCNQLRNRPRLVVGTPGRIDDHLRRGNLDLDDARFLVLDEMDRMLDMGFSIQIDAIVKHIPNDRQTLMFSATMPGNIMKMADKYLDNPERVAVGSTINPAKNIKQEILHVSADTKYSTLVNELHARTGSVIIFVKTKRGADKMAKKLNNDEFDAQAIHGDLQQRKRDRVIKEYRNKRFRILVATDVVSRGLDVPHIEHVINYDLPQVPEDYIHRIGRTARAGASGSALCLLSPQDGRKWHAIEVLMDPSKKKSTRGPARNDNKKRSRNGGGKKFGNKSRSFDRDSRRSRDDSNGEERSFNKGKKFNRDDRSKRDGESRSSEGRKFNNEKRFKNKEERGGESRSSEGRKFNKDKSFKHDDRNSNETRNSGDKPFSKKKPFNKDSKPKRNNRDDRNSGGGDAKYSKYSKGSSNQNPKRKFSGNKKKPRVA